MNCSLASHLIDDYLDNRLSWSERQRLERHLAACPRCRSEADHRSRLEHAAWQTLTASVRDKSLSAASSARLVREAQVTLRRAVVHRRIGLAARTVAAVAAVALVLAGVLAALGRLPALAELRPVALLPLAGLFAPDRGMRPTAPEDWVVPVIEPASESAADWPGLGLSRGESLIEPEQPSPGDDFVIITYLESNLPEPLDSVRLDVEISGPTGTYLFPLKVNGPLPATGISILDVDSDVLTAPCLAKYHIAPTEIFGLPGDYVVRVVLHSPAVATMP